MIGLLAAAVLQTYRTAEVLDAGSPTVIVQAYIPAPLLSAREMATSRVLSECLLLGSREFTKYEISRFGSQAGSPPKVSWMPDFIKIQIAAPAGGLDVIFTLMESLLRHPNLDPDDIVKVRKDLSEVARTPWQEALVPQVLDYSKVRASDVRETYSRLFKPDRILFAAGGPLGSGELARAVAKHFSDWKPAHDRWRVADVPPIMMSERNNPVSSLEFLGPVLLSPSETYSATLLAMFGLGVGKEATLHRIMREIKGWTYRQEAVIWPTLDGWRPRLILLREGNAISPVLARKAILDDIDSWTDASLVRAKAMSQSALKGKFELNPFWLDDSSPMTTSLGDRLSWTAYAVLVHGPTLLPSELAGTFDSVDLASFKRAAKQMIEASIAVAINGK